MGVSTEAFAGEQLRVTAECIPTTALHRGHRGGLTGVLSLQATHPRSVLRSTPQALP